MKMVNGFPRRARIDLYTKEELAFRELTLRVEELGAHPLLTDVVVLLGKAQNKLADWIELQDESRPTTAASDTANAPAENGAESK